MAGAPPEPRALRDVRMMAKPGVQLAVSNTLSEVRPLQDEEAERIIFDSLSRVDQQTLLAIFSNVNSRILASSTLVEHELHQQLERDLVSDDLRAGLEKARRHEEQPDFYVVFTRRSILLLIKLTLGVARTGAEEKFEEHIAGELALAANEFFDLQNEDSSDASVMLESLASWDLYNPGNATAEIARFDLLISDLFSDDAAITESRTKFGFSDRAFDGLTFDEYRALVFNVYSMIGRGVKNGDAPVLEVKRPLPKFLGPEEAVINALDTRAWSVGGNFDDPIFGGSWTRERLSELLKSSRFLNDNTWIRQKPFVRLRDGRYLLPDYFAALTRMTSGLFWTLFDRLPTGKIREDFFNLWGRVFERYVVRLLSHFYPGSSVLADRLRANVSFEDNDVRGEIDCLLDFGDHVILFEVKSSPLPLQQRTARDMELLDRWVETRLVRTDEGKKKALIQLADGARAVAHGRVFKGEQPKLVYPVLLTDEIAFEALGFNRYLAPKFESCLDDDDRTRIRPLTVVHTGELERALPFVEGNLFDWRNVLESRFTDRQVAWFSFGQASYDHLAGTGKHDEKRRNLFLWERFEVFVQEMKKRMQEELARGE